MFYIILSYVQNTGQLHVQIDVPAGLREHVYGNEYFLSMTHADHYRRAATWLDDMARDLVGIQKI